ncbi:unnamed protein product [Discosporangium mesarthrocarpum]
MFAHIQSSGRLPGRGRRGWGRGRGRWRGSSPKSNSPATASSEKAPGVDIFEFPLVSVTTEDLEKVRDFAEGIFDEKRAEVAAGRGKVKRKLKVGTVSNLDGVVEAVTQANLTAYQAAVMEDVVSFCEVKEVREEREAYEILESLAEVNKDLQDTKARLRIKRARVMQLATAAYKDELEASNARQERRIGALAHQVSGQGAKAGEGATAKPGGDGGEHATRVLESDPNSTKHGGGGSSVDSLAVHRGDSNGSAVSGLDERVLESKVSALIMAMADLPGPLKSLLQELPERRDALASTLQAVESSLASSGSVTEDMLRKTVPSAGAGKGKRTERHHPGAARVTAREAKSKQAVCGGGTIPCVCQTWSGKEHSSEQILCRFGWGWKSDFRNRKEGTGRLMCRMCEVQYEMTINYLTEPIDIYTEWIDECEAVNAVEGGET